MNQSTDPSELKELYDEAYAKKLLASEESRRIPAILRCVTLQTDARILDVGCGNGPLASYVAQNIGEYHGIDFSEAFVQQAQAIAAAKGLANCHFQVADVVRFIDSRPGQFDAVFALDISEHVPDAEWIVYGRRIQTRAEARRPSHRAHAKFEFLH
ncbi:MAG: class I SAM-dependent methyltransferase [Rhodanobacteraceae bacterium]